jgi:hypothetical protein
MVRTRRQAAYVDDFRAAHLAAIGWGELGERAGTLDDASLERLAKMREAGLRLQRHPHRVAR